MQVFLLLLLVVILFFAGWFIYSRISAKATLERYANKARDRIQSDEEIYKALVSCVIINGKEYSTIEEIENDLAERDRTISALEESGFGSNLYPNLNETQKRIYLIVHGYDLSLIPQYLLEKSLNNIGE